MPPVTASSTWSVRRTVAGTPVMPAASVTGPMRSAVARADSGRVAASPNGVWPGATRSRSVPSSSSSASRLARLDAEIPTTATMAAMPMAMPSAVSDVRSRRACSPTAAVRNRSTSRSRLEVTCAVMPGAPTTWRVDGRVISMTRPSRMVTRRGARAAISRSWVISTIVRPCACRSTSRSTIASPVRLSRLPVGSSARTIAGSPISALAMATRWRSPPDRAPGRCVARSARPTAASASRARASALALRHTGVEQATGDVLQRGQCLDEVELLEHEADAPPAERCQTGIAQATDVVAIDAHGPAVGRCRAPTTLISVDFPEPDGPTRATNSPAWTVRSIPASASTGGWPG